MVDSDRQRLNVLLFYAFVFMIVYVAFRIVQPFIMTLLWAGVLALCAHPVFHRLRKRCNAVTAALLATILVALLLVLPAIGILTALVKEAGLGVKVLQDAADDVRNHEKLWSAIEWLRARVPIPGSAELKPKLMELGASFTNFVASSATAVLQNMALLVFRVFIALVALFFLLRDSEALKAFVLPLLPFDEQRKRKLIAQTRDLVFAGTLTTLTVSAAQGLAGGAAFAILGLNAPVLWGCVMAACALIPLLGTALVWAPAAVWLMATGSWGQGVALAVMGIAIVGGLDNVLRPAMMSGKSAMNGLVAMLSIMGGLAAFGFIGLVLGPVVAAAVITLLKLAASEAG